MQVSNSACLISQVENESNCVASSQTPKLTSLGDICIRQRLVHFIDAALISKYTHKVLTMQS